MVSARPRHLFDWGNSAAQRWNIMNTEKSVTIADLDVELSAIGGYDSVSGMPCGSLVGPIRPFIRPESAGDVPNLVPVAAA